MRNLARRAVRRAGRLVRDRARSDPSPVDSPLVAAAIRAGWADNEPNRQVLEALELACRARPSVDLAVLVSKRNRGIPGIVTEAFPHARATAVHVGASASRVHVQLSALGPFDVIIDDTRVAGERVERFRLSFLHLREGGTYLVRARRAGADQLSPDEESITDFLQRLVVLREANTSDPLTRREEDELRLAQSIGDLGVLPRHLTVRKTGETWAKLKDRQVNGVLDLRQGESGRVLDTVPGLRLTSRCELRESPSTRAGLMPKAFKAPALSLRSYNDAVCAPGQVVTLGHLLLPDSYRHHRRRRLRNRFVQDLAPTFGRPTEDLSDPAFLAGSYYYLDSEFRGHFGHALTEQVSRFWGWAEAKRADPTLKALVATNLGRARLASFEKDLLAAGGIEAEDIELIDRPVRVERLIAATPMLDNPAYVHPDILRTWGEVGRRLSEQAPDRAYPRRIFCSRREQTGPGGFSGVRRECRNGQQLEQAFAQHGFEVVYTEDYDLPEQARMIREAEVVAGYAGSAMFNLIFADTPKHVIVVSSESYTAKNEYVISSVAGHRLDITWCVAEIPMPPGQWDTTAFNSPFSFDFAREGAFLAEVFAGL